MLKQNRGIILILIAAVIWSTSFVATKVLLNHVPALTIGAIRFALSALILGVLVGRSNLPKLPRRHKIQCSIAGFFGIFLYMTAENLGVDYATVNDAVLITAAYPMITLFIEKIIDFHKKIYLITIIGMFLTLTGVVLISASHVSTPSENRFLGICLFIIGGIVWALFNIISRKQQTDSPISISPIVTTYYQTLAGAFFFMLMIPLENHTWNQINYTDILLLIYLGIPCSVLAFIAYNAGLATVPAATAVNLLNVVPLLGMVQSVLFLGEQITIYYVIGGALILLGVYLGCKKPKLKLA